MFVDIGALTHLYVVNGVLKDERAFAETYCLVQNALLDRKFCPLLQNVLLRDPNLLSLVIFSYCQRIMEASVDAAAAVKLFIFSIADPLTWFSTECMNRGMKIFSFQVLVWVLTMGDNLHQSVFLEDMQYMDETVAIVFHEFTAKHKHISDQLNTALAGELVEHAVSGPDKIKVLLNSLCQLFGRSDVRESILLTVKAVYKSRADKHEKLPCEAQILANCGTAFISHKGSYQIGDFHVYLAQSFFREAKSLLPDQVCAKQSSHLDKNIRIAQLVPDVRRVLWEVNHDAELSGKKLEHLQEVVARTSCFQAPSAAELKDICSAIKFVLQMTVNASDPQGLQKVVNTLQNLSRLFSSVHRPDLSRKCEEWAKSATYRDRSILA